ncbi:12221_t:CDS:2 [Rhizophagus irregularis]|nr:12221_t:CDS:2 [Rhizophagus irregularis]
MGTLVFDGNEAMRNEYISSILHAAPHIVRRITSKEINLLLQLEVGSDGMLIIVIQKCKTGVRGYYWFIER